MRPNKLKLAAVVMSAIMAAGTAPVTAFAEDFDVAEVYVEAAAEVEEAVPQAEADVVANYNAVKDDKVEFSYDDASGKAYATYTLINKDDTTVEPKKEKKEATIVSKEAATYKEGSKLTVSYKVLDKTYTEIIYLDDVLTSDNVFKNVKIVTVAPTCEKPGTATVYETVTLVPGATLNSDGSFNQADFISGTGESEVEIPALTEDGQHTEKVTTRYEPVKNVKIVNDTPTLISFDEPYGTYYEYTSSVCTTCGVVLQEETKSELKYLYPGDVIIGSASISDSENIYGYVKDNQIYTDFSALELDDLPINNDSIILVDSKKDGKYTITYTYKNGAVAYKDTVKVTAHVATVKRIKVKNNADKGLVEVTNEAKLEIKNNTCSKDVAYYEATVDAYKYAQAGNDVYAKGVVTSNGTEKSAPASTIHNIAAVKKEVVLAGGSLEALKVLEKAGKIKLANNTSSHTSDGTIDVSYICATCNKVAATETISVSKHTAKPGAYKSEVTKEASCTATGEVKSYRVCDICGEIIDDTVKTSVLAKLPHTFVAKDGTYPDKDAVLDLVGDIVVGGPYEKGEVVYYNSSAYNSEGEPIRTGRQAGTTGYAVIARVYTTCEVCGEKHYFVNDTLPTPKLVVVDVQPEAKGGEAGSITLEATYTTSLGTKDAKELKATVTVPYYSSWISYLDRHDTTLETKEGLTKDTDNVWRYYKKGEFQENFTGIVEYNGGEFYVEKGVYKESANGLTLVGEGDDAKWLFLANGQVQRVSQFAEYDNNWFKINNGELDTTANGLYDYNGGTFLLSTGKIRTDVNGLWQNAGEGIQNADGKWYFLANGQVVDYSGVAEYDGAFFVVEKGILDSAKNGTVEYDGATFNVVAGQLQDKVA